MTTSLTTSTPAPLSFSFDSSSQIRVLSVDGMPWFVARDVASALGYADSPKAVAAHCKRAKPLSELGWAIHPPEQNQPLDPQTKLIPEPDVYRLIARSKLPSAEAFEVWLFEEVLPSIRKTGRYQVAPVVAAPAAPVETITRTQLAELNAAVGKAFCYSWLLGQTAAQHGHNSLRVHFHLRTLEDLPAAEFQNAMQRAAWMGEVVEGYFRAVSASRDQMFAHIEDGAPWTPALLRKMTDDMLKALPPRPDWRAIQQQLGLDKAAQTSAA